MPHSRRLCLVLATVVLLSACAHTGSRKSPSVTATSEAFNYFSGDFENTEAIKRKMPASVAVLPFEGDPAAWSGVNPDEDPLAVVRRGFYNHFSSLPFQDLEPGEVDARLANAGLDAASARALLESDPRRLKSILGTDAVVLGQVTHFDRVYMGLASQVAVGCRVGMHDLDNGALLWRAEHVARGFGGGVALDPVGLIINAAAALWNLRGVELLRQTDELFREMVETIHLPESLRAARIRPPVADLFAVVGQGPYRAGSRILFRLVGDPGGRAYADLQGFRSALEMLPVSAEAKAALQADLLQKVAAAHAASGHDLTPELLEAVRARLAQREVYEGTYAVLPGEEARGLWVQGSLVGADGGKAVMLDPAGTVDVDAVPPAAPAGLRAEPLDRKMRLNWGGNREKDLAGYEVWSSPTQLSGFERLDLVQSPTLTVQDLTNFEPRWYKVAAVDTAGNVGEFSPTIKAAPSPVTGLAGLPSPGPNLGGEIAEPIVLEAARNPFVVRSDLVIAPGGVLYIEPGVELRFTAGTALRVAGGDILAFGRPDAPVRLVSAAGPEAKPGAWQGVVLDNAGRADLHAMTIDGAVTGLTVTGCAPELDCVVLTRSAQAGLHLKDQARPSVTCSRIQGNGGMGGLVMEGKGLAPRFQQTTFSDNEPFDVQSFSPVEMDLSGNWWGQGDPALTTLGFIRHQPALSGPPTGCPKP